MWEADESQDLWADSPAVASSRGPAAGAGREGGRFVTGDLTADDLDVERSLRPNAWMTTAGRSTSSRACAS